MVGGEILLVVKQPDKVTIFVQGTGCESGSRLAICTEPTDEPLQAGDSIWWQAQWALWTPKDRSREDVKLNRIGYSHSVESAAAALVRRGICPECGCPQTMNGEGVSLGGPAHYLWCPACEASLCVLLQEAA